MTTAERSTVLATTRAWIERRQKVSPRRKAAGQHAAARGAEHGPPTAVPAL